MSSRGKRSRSRSREKKYKRDRSRTRQQSISISASRSRDGSRWSDAPMNSMSSYNSSSVSSYDKDLLNYPSKAHPSYGMSSSVNPNILYTLNDNSKIKRKIFIPKVSGVNYVGLLIGPRGTYQKRLELQSGCKILIRGKGTQKDGLPSQPDDNEEQHVLIVGETEENVNKAQYLVEKVLYADEFTRTRIRDEQLKASQEMRTELFLLPGLTDANGKPIPQEIDDSLMTPYGPPDRNARILPVPNDCVGLIIGKNGETIRRLHRETGCKIQIAKKEIPNTDVRNVFIEGPPEKYENAKKLIEEIIAEQQFLKQNFSHLGDINPFPGPHTPLRIPNKMVGLIIGKNGETVRNIHQKTGCFIFIPKDSRPGEDFRELELSGPLESVEMCKREIISMIHLALYGRLPYMNSLFYPYIDPVTGLPIIDANIMANLDPNTPKSTKSFSGVDFNQIGMNISMTMTGLDFSALNQSMSTDYEGNAGYTDNSDYYSATEQPGYEEDYNLSDYNNPKNYDLYYQSLYQMYPQMSDYVKKKNAEASSEDPSESVQSSTPCVLFNMGILDPQSQENNLYDPNFISNYYRMNMQQQISQSGGMSQENKQDGEDVFDPFGIKSEMGDFSHVKNEDGTTTAKPAHHAPKQEIDYSKYDYNKYVEHMYSNQGKKGQKGQKGRTTSVRDIYKSSDYDKNEVNEDVFRYYEEFYKDEQPEIPHVKVGFEDISIMEQQNNFMRPPQVKDHEGFAMPMSKPKRRSRFDDSGASGEPMNNNQQGNGDDIKIENINR